MPRSIRIRKGANECRVPAALISFIVPRYAKEAIDIYRDQTGVSQQIMMGEGLDMWCKARGLPPLGIRSMRDEPDLS